MKYLLLMIVVTMKLSWAGPSPGGADTAGGGGGTTGTTGVYNDGGADGGALDGGYGGGSTSGGTTTGGGSSTGGSTTGGGGTTPIGSTGYRLTPGSSQFIRAYSLCGTITNNFSTDLFLSFKSEKEWKTVLSAASPNISVARNDCSCKSLLAMGNMFSGIYTMDPDGAGPLAPNQVYCDMETSGGGWTLVGRSVAGGVATTFGWKSTEGFVTTDSQPYSLGIIPAMMDFSEVLIGNYTSGKTWGLNVYQKPVPADLFTTYENDSIWTGNPTPLYNGNAGFGMAGRMGHSSLTVVFYFRDTPGSSTHGLNPNGWDTAYSTIYGGLLYGLQGMVMVR